MFNSGICIIWTRINVAGHCATIIIGQKCRNQVFDPDGLGPMCPDTEQQFNSGICINYLDGLGPMCPDTEQQF